MTCQDVLEPQGKQLTRAEAAAMDAHVKNCAVCGAFFRGVKRGIWLAQRPDFNQTMQWAEEVERKMAGDPECNP